MTGPGAACVGNRSAIGLGSIEPLRLFAFRYPAWPALRTTLRKNSIRPVTNSSVKSRAASMTILRRYLSRTSPPTWSTNLRMASMACLRLASTDSSTSSESSAQRGLGLFRCLCHYQMSSDFVVTLQILSQRTATYAEPNAMTPYATGTSA